MDLSHSTVDLHLHTSASDGTTSPDKLLDEVESAGLKTISVTDHESIEGMDSIADKAAGRGLTMIPGIEFCTYFQGQEIHLLGYCFDLDSRIFRSRVKELRQERNRTSIQTVENLCRFGFKLEMAPFYSLIDRGGTIGKNHIFRALFKAGYLDARAESWEALKKYMARDGLAYVQFRGHPFAEAVELIRECNGIPVLAHPGLIRDDHLVVELLNSAPVGLEVYYYYFGTNQRQLIIHYERMAAERGLPATGGSDYHGCYTPGIKLGTIMVPEETVELLTRRQGRI